MRKYVAPETVFGCGAATLAGRYARSLGAVRPLVVSDAGVEAAGWTARAIDSCRREGLEPLAFTGVSPNPRAAEVARGVEAFADGRCDAVIAVGGGSPMDAAKGIAVASANGQDVRFFEGVDRVVRPGPPIVCVASTAGTGSEVSRFAIINDESRRVKIAIVSPKVVPDAALVDPELLATVPPALAAATGMDALTHAIEAYLSTAASALTDLDALRAVRLVGENLARVVASPADHEAAGAMALASMLAGRAFSNAGLGVVHAMAHALGGLLDAPHGLCNALLLDVGIETNAPVSEGRLADLALELGAELGTIEARGAARVMADGVRALRESIGIKAGLAALGVSRGELPRLASFAVRDACLATNPTPLDAGVIEGLYARAL